MKNRVKEEHRRNTKNLYYVVAIVFILAASSYYLAEKDIIADLTFFAMFSISIILAIWGNVKFRRCPSCEGHIGKLYFGLQHPKYCPECGIELLDKD